MREATNDEPWCVTRPSAQTTRLPSAGAPLLHSCRTSPISASTHHACQTRKANLHLFHLAGHSTSTTHGYPRAPTALIPPPARNSMRSCPLSTRDSWRRRRGNGGRSTRCVDVRLSGRSAADTSLQQALQLLEYLVKNGSERVVDDARSHLSTIKMLRSFHYIDDKGKDQGLNGM